MTEKLQFYIKLLMTLLVCSYVSYTNGADLNNDLHACFSIAFNIRYLDKITGNNLWNVINRKLIKQNCHVTNRLSS